MGFDEPSCRIALEKCNNSVDRALDMLLSGMDLLTSRSSIQQDVAVLSPSTEHGNIMQLEISQYTFSDAGSSACTAIALSAMKSFLELLDKGHHIDLSSDSTLQISLSDAIFAGVSYFSTTALSRDRHASVDEIGAVAMTGLVNITPDLPEQGMLSEKGAFAAMFASVRRKATTSDKYIGIVITKPPETVCVVLPPNNLISAAGATTTDNSSGTFLFFDSHSRPELGFNGCYLVSSDKERDIIQRLDAIFPAFTGFGDCDGGGDVEQFDLAEAMYNMFEGTAFQLDAALSGSSKGTIPVSRGSGAGVVEAWAGADGIDDEH